mgnify:FL=1
MTQKEEPKYERHAKPVCDMPRNLISTNHLQTEKVRIVYAIILTIIFFTYENRLAFTRGSLGILSVIVAI